MTRRVKLWTSACGVTCKSDKVVVLFTIFGCDAILLFFSQTQVMDTRYPQSFSFFLLPSAADLTHSMYQVKMSEIFYEIVFINGFRLCFWSLAYPVRNSREDSACLWCVKAVPGGLKRSSNVECFCAWMPKGPDTVSLTSATLGLCAPFSHNCSYSLYSS